MISMTWPQYLRNECSVGDFKVHLSQQETEVLSVMLMRYPLPTDILTLIEAVWPIPDFEPEAAYPSIYQALHRLRYKLGAFRIAPSGHFGWFDLVQEPSVRPVYCTKLPFAGVSTDA